MVGRFGSALSLVFWFSVSTAGAATMVQCEGVDDTAALQGALTAAAKAEGGATILVHSPRGCLVRSELRVGASTVLRGEPRAKIVASPDGDLGRGLFVVTGDDARLEDLEVDLGVHGGPAVRVAPAVRGEGRFRLERVRIASDAGVSATADLVDIECGPGVRRCAHLIGLEVTCRSSAGAGQTAVVVRGAPASVATVVLQDTVVEGCRGGLRAENVRVRVEDSSFTVVGEGATAIDVGAEANIVGSRVDVSGPSAGRVRGIVAGELAYLSGNRVGVRHVTGTAVSAGRGSRLVSNSASFNHAPTSVGFDVGGYGTVEGNRIWARESAGAVGAELGGSSNVLSSNNFLMAGAAENTHVLISSDQNLIQGNVFRGGDWGVRPRVFREGGSEGFVNGARLVGNNMMGLRRGCAVLLTGWHAQSNHCTWLGAGAAGFWIGSPGVVGGCTAHTLLSGNTIHAGKPTASLVRFGGAGSARACAAVGIEGNLLMGWAGAPIDIFSRASPGDELPRLRNIRVTNNSVGLAGASRPLVAFSPTLSGEERSDVKIRDNGTSDKYGPSRRASRSEGHRLGALVLELLGVVAAVCAVVDPDGAEHENQDRW